MAGGMLSDLCSSLKRQMLLASLHAGQKAVAHKGQALCPVLCVGPMTQMPGEIGVRNLMSISSLRSCTPCFYRTPKGRVPLLDSSWILKAELLSLRIQVALQSLFSR